jgi:hypothetical protein
VPSPAATAPADVEDVAHFRRHGWVLWRVLDAAGVVALRTWIDEVADLGPPVLHHHELTDDGPRLCRTENFVPVHAGLGTFLTAGPMVAFASALLGEPAVLYKEKVNYKLPGGAGYSAHQDARAYPFIDEHVSCMVAVDDATTTNGCLEVVTGAHDDLLATDDRGCLTEAVVAALQWTPVEVKAGETLWFHSRTPHRSGANHSGEPRRAIYPTYNAASEGDRRAEYYEAKRSEFAHTSSRPGRVRVSLIGDFEGRPVTGS